MHTQKRIKSGAKVRFRFRAAIAVSLDVAIGGIGGPLLFATNKSLAAVVSLDLRYGASRTVDAGGAGADVVNATNSSLALTLSGTGILMLSLFVLYLLAELVHSRIARNAAH
jgi:hypothetical protein